MKLKFLGIGSAFNPTLGNTSAYFIEGEDFYLLDCGESVFEKIWNLKELKESKNIYILITHFHCDHVGSLGSLLSYLYLKLNKVAYVIHPTKKIIDYLNIVGIKKEFYIYKKELPEFSKIKNEEYEVYHVDDMLCFGYKLISEKKQIYYSGDAVKIPNQILEEYLNGKISEIYQDTCNYKSDNPSHGDIFYLEDIIPENKRNNVYCIHLNIDYREELKLKKFGIVELI